MYATASREPIRRHLLPDPGDLTRTLCGKKVREVRESTPWGLYDCQSCLRMARTQDVKSRRRA